MLIGTSVQEVAGDVLACWEDRKATRLAYLATLGAPPPRPTPRDRPPDALDEIPPAAYVEALTGVPVPAHGTVRCPLPDHDERTPSFHAYPTAEEGWFCFGCGRGGDVYTLAAELWGLSTRGPAFIELRRQLARRVLEWA